MNQASYQARYRSLSIFMHWLMLLLLIAVYACIELREMYPKGSDPREALKTWHFMLGLTVFLLVWIRIVARLTGSIPVITPSPKPWSIILAKSLHYILYAFMILMPFSGWLLLSAAGKPIPFFGLELPALMGKSKEVASFIKEAHEVVGTLGYFLIGIHTVAALLHHYIMKDDTLLRMLPGKRR